MAYQRQCRQRGKRFACGSETGSHLGRASPVVLVVKNPPANLGDIRETDSIPRSRRSPGGGNGNPTPVFLPGESLGQRNQLGYFPQGCKESHMTEATLHSPDPCSHLGRGCHKQRGKDGNS